MKTIIFYVLLASFSFATKFAQAQEDSTAVEQQKENFQKNQEEMMQKEKEYLQKKREEIIQEEKGKLRVKIENINGRLEKGEIDQEKADQLKKEAAELHALNIENRVAILENEVEFNSRNDQDKGGYIAMGDDKVITFQVNAGRNRKYDKRTTSDIVLAAGFNNAIAEGQSLNDSDFKIGGSRFFEIGWAWKTRVFDDSNWLRFKYGFSFQFNGLKPTDNRYLVNNDGMIDLEKFDYDLEKSKFRMDNLVVPIHFEFGPSERQESEKTLRFSTEDKFKIGLGGYVGFGIGERQKLKYSIDGDKQKDKLKADYNRNDLVYGLSAYIGWGGAALYAKYDLNPVFKNQPTDLHNVSIGLRFDVD